MAQLLIKGTKVAEVVGDTTSLIANTLYHPSGTQIITDDGGTVGLTNVNLQNINFENVANDSISGDKIHGGTISGSLLHTDVTFADVNSSVVNDSISGDKIHGGTISGFQSTGITDNSSNTVITVHSSERLGIGTTNPSEKLHVYDNSINPYVLVDGSAGNRDCGYKINAGNGVKVAIRADANGHFYINDNSIAIMPTIGNGQYKTSIFDSEIQVGGLGSNPARVVISRLIEPKDVYLTSGWTVETGQSDTVTGIAFKRPSSASNNTGFYGPYNAIPPGSYTALFRMKVTSNTSTAAWGYIDVAGTGIIDPVGGTTRPRIQYMYPSSFDASNIYQYFALDFEATSVNGFIEVRWIDWRTGITDLWFDHILIVPRLNHN